jgi:hypothetical protein
MIKADHAVDTQRRGAENAEYAEKYNSELIWADDVAKIGRLSEPGTVRFIVVAVSERSMFFAANNTIC